MTITDRAYAKAAPRVNIWTARELLWAWTTRTIRARYKQSILGGLWAIIQPAARAVILTIIFTRFIQIDTGNTPYIVFSYVAMVPWMFFSSALTDMVESLVHNMNLVTKIFFPREILPVAALLARFLDFAIAAVLLVVLMLLYRLPVLTVSLVYLPIVFLLQFALTLGLGLAGAAITVFYRDISHLFTFAIQILFYATPIIYPVSRVPESYQALYFLNPMAAIIEAYRSILLYQTPPDITLYASIPVVLLILILGYWIFKRLEAFFADVI